MIDRRRMGRSRSRSPDQAAENYAAVATSITYAAFVLRIITGLVVCAVMLSTASFVMNGLNLREKKETRQQLMQEVLETRLLIYDLKRIADQQKRKSEEIFDEVLRVKDGIKGINGQTTC
ncbi:uncharacterized protein LOC120330417 [Styela clava]|uniref:uncharacterized protein LOC120330417 n=1 Tax=Styela clava TaxID=7725 RepID=UPI00193A560D|nr:uncharacterized protein LOC120330417 [Styela clava]